MKNIAIRIIMLLLISFIFLKGDLMCQNPIAPPENVLIGQITTSKKITKEERLKWWLDARFGMMIHWGAYAQAGEVWKGKYEEGYSEWLRFRQIPGYEYDSLIMAFNPVDFDAEKWVAIAKNAGMKYIVFTAKHHDGFAMYDSPISRYNIVGMTKFGRDPVGELAKACQKAGLKFGVYYSVDRDWHHPDAACDTRYKQCNFWDYPGNKAGGMDRWHNNYFPNYAVKQVTELVTQYPIDIVWFDGIGLKTRAEVALLDSIIHTNRPYCLINSRISSFVDSKDGDYGSKGDNETPNGYQAGAWENPGTLGFSYGYSAHDKFMSPKKAIENLIEIVSKGGNYLLNVGPDGKGVIIPEAVSILDEMGKWLKKYGSSIYGANGMPVKPPENVLFTVKPHRLFVHVLNWNRQELKIPEMDRIFGKCIEKVKKIYMLADPRKRPLKYELKDGTLTINLYDCPIPVAEINKYSEVIVVSGESRNN
jgi:alpha-L-fucosidase